MSHQTGIQANEELQKFFGKCKLGEVRSFKVVITNEQLVLETHHAKKGSWENDYEAQVPPMLKEKEPCYVFVRLDSKDSASGGFEWLLLSYSPDDAPVRLKMLYASTKATLKKAFGGGALADEMFACSVREASLSAVKQHMRHATPPLSMAERELEAIKKAEQIMPQVTPRDASLKGVAFPLTDEAKKECANFAKDKRSYVQFKIDVKKEVIESVDSTAVTTAAQMIEEIPPNEPRYHLFRFPHKFEGKSLKSVVFIYSLPSEACPVKLKMLYSSCKAPLLEALAALEIEIEKKVETDDPSELKEEALMDLLHPAPAEGPDKKGSLFSKPKGPANRGAKRLIKSPQ